LIRDAHSDDRLVQNSDFRSSEPFCARQQLHGVALQMISVKSSCLIRIPPPVEGGSHANQAGD
jgi:hypothetical protein